jgi:hypothetical protein
VQGDISPARDFFEGLVLAQYEHLPIYKAAFDLLFYFEKIVKNVSRLHLLQIGVG